MATTEEGLLDFERNAAKALTNKRKHGFSCAAILDELKK
jgi:hypothetical protein